MLVRLVGCRCVLPLAAVLCLPLALGCAPEWVTEPATSGAVPRPAATTSAAADPEEQLLEEYRTTPLGERVRSKRITVVFVNMADMALYHHGAAPEPQTISTVMRSYTSFKSESVADLVAFFTAVKSGYVVSPAEFDEVLAFVQSSIAPVEYYRLDARYRIGAEKGALFIYDHGNDEGDVLLASRLISAPAARAVLHYTDTDGWGTGEQDTVLGDHYVLVHRDGRLDLVEQGQPTSE